MALLERQAELDLIAGAVSGAERGRGSVVLLSGPAGIGKTAVLTEAAQRTAIRRLWARGGELERHLALGVARQLLEPALDSADGASRDRLLEGTGPAAAALGGRVGAGEGDQSAILHGLHRLVVNLAADGPLVLEVDDVQWADASSLRFLAFHARRLGELPILLLLARRSGEPATDPAAWRALVELPEAKERTLTALSLPAAAELVRRLVGASADELFCAACHAASAGNPFVLRELVMSLLARGVSPDADGAAKVAEAGPPTVARWVLGRLERLSTAATDLARAVAVLGEDAQLRRAARLADQPLCDAEQALDELIGNELLAPGSPPRFVHPVVRAAVHETMPTGSRSRAHRAAARLLREEAAEPGKAAAHLLAVEPGGEPWVAEALLDAAHIALAQGAPEVAASQAQRALSEPPDARTLAPVLRALGNAERRLGAPRADERFVAALEGTCDPRERAETVLDMLIMGVSELEQPDVIARTRQALEDIAPVDPGLALVLRARLLLALEAATEPIDEDLRAAERALARADEESLGTRLIAGMLAFYAALRGEPRGVVVPLAMRAVGDDSGYAHDLRAGYPHVYALNALAVTDELALARKRFTEAEQDADRRGSLVGVGIACFLVSHVDARLGDLAAAEGAARRALVAAEHAAALWLDAAGTAVLVEALIARGELQSAEAALEQHNLSASSPVTTPFLAEAALARSLLHLETGRPTEAHADATAARGFAQAAGVRNPVLSPWRSRAALALIALGQPADALELAREELAIAETADIPSAIGATRRVVALATGGGAVIPLLQEAVATLEATDARLELIRALVDLGAALRRAGRRSEAREPLSRALELAHRHGATLLAQSARTELLATGARPRRAVRTGLDALTPSERRVAELAATGLTNAQIAARLFITVKTTEHHLAAIFRKLDISSRRELPRVLTPAATGP